MKKIIRLTESDLNKIVKITINESLNQVAEDFRGTCRRVSSSLDDLDSATKRGDSRKIDEAKDLVKHQVRRLENLIDELKRKLR
jgi:hypothetical protein